MANRKISQLTALTTPAAGDYLPIVDISEAAAADQNKRITIEELLRGAPDGTAAAPSIAFESDPNTGIYSPGADQVAISTGGTGRLFVNSSGNVGIGTTSPGAPLEIAGSTNGDQLRINQSGQYYRIGREGSGGLLEFWGAQSGYNGYIFGGANGERLRIDSSGNVGIGQSSPNAKFTVLANSSDTNPLDQGSPATSSGATFQNYLFSTGTYSALSLETANASTIQSASVVAQSVSGGTAPNLLFTQRVTNTTNATRMIIDSAGNVGIGTSSPARKFHTVSAQTNVIRVENTSTNDAVIEYAGTASSSYAGHSGGSFVIAPAGTERLRIDSSGNVGIGTTSPGALLHLYGTTAEQIRLHQGGSGISNSKITATRGLTLGADYDNNSGTDGYVSFETGANERMRIDSAGNVGIGTSSPGRLLHLARSSGNPDIRLSSANQSTGLEFVLEDGTGYGYITAGETAGELVFRTGGNNERLRIDSAGNVGIGTTSPGNYSGRSTLALAGTTNAGLLEFRNSAGVQSTYYANANGNVVITAENTSSTATNINIKSRGAAGTINFETADIERLRIDSAGYLRLASGSGGIQFNGDTAAANALDDYEEGTWTPALNWTNVTYSAQQGKYTKIGNRVFFSINLIWTANDASTNTIINLPFASTSSNERAVISVQNMAFPANFQYPVADIFSSSLYVRYVNTSGGYSLNYGVAANDAGTIAVNGNYAVA